MVEMLSFNFLCFYFFHLSTLYVQVTFQSTCYVKLIQNIFRSLRGITFFVPFELIFFFWANYEKVVCIFLVLILVFRFYCCLYCCLHCWFCYYFTCCFCCYSCSNFCYCLCCYFCCCYLCYLLCCCFCCCLICSIMIYCSFSTRGQ